MLFIISFDFDGLKSDKDGVHSRINNKIIYIYKFHIYLCFCSAEKPRLMTFPGADAKMKGKK